MKKEIHIKFVDFWNGFDDKDNFIYKILAEKYNVILSDQPQYLIYSVFGCENTKYDCIKIFYTGENVTPNFNMTDYAIGFDHLELGDRYMRIPLYKLYDQFEHLRNDKKIDSNEALNRKFCSFVYSNNMFADSCRIDFFHALSNYKHIDSGGGLLNNIGGKVDDKLEFIKNYKFCIAFENSAYDGYITEKMIDPMIVNSIPIYWGNPRPQLDFNPKSFINVRDYSSYNELIEYIKYLDENDDAYIEKLNEPWITDKSMFEWENKATSFLTNIFDQDIDEAQRICKFGRQALDRKNVKTELEKDEKQNEHKMLMKIFKKIFKK